MQIYKYGAKFVFSCLQTQRIKVSAAHELNDPFELSPKVDVAKFTITRAMQFLRRDHMVAEHYAAEGRRLGFSSKRKYKQHYMKTLRRRAESLMPNVPRNVEAARDRFSKTFSEYWRLFCASKRRDSVLMWSHYAANHSGAVVGFDAGASPFCDLGEDFVVPVRYTDEKPEFYYRPKSVTEFENALRHVASAKSPEWSYEEEIRFMFPISAVRDKQFIPFPSESVRTVILGALVSSEDRSRYRDLLLEKRYAHVELLQASLSKERYALDFNEAREAEA